MSSHYNFPQLQGTKCLTSDRTHRLGWNDTWEIQYGFTLSSMLNTFHTTFVSSDSFYYCDKSLLSVQCPPTTA